MPRPIITAHRAGAALGPENSLAALEAAIRAGAEFAEIDLQLTADRVPVVIHDESLLRAAGIDKRVWEIVSAALPRLGSGETLPTLADFLRAARGRIGLNLELKDYGHSTELVARVFDTLRVFDAPRVFDALEGWDRSAGLVICSFSAPLVRAARAMASSVPIGRVLDARGDLPAAGEADFVSVDHRVLDAALMSEARRRGFGVHAWTVNDALDMKRLATLGVDHLITDNPAAARRVLA